MSSKSFFKKFNPDILMGGVDVMTFLPDMLAVNEEMNAKIAKHVYDGEYFSALESVKKNLAKKMFTMCVQMLNRLRMNVFHLRLPLVQSALLVAGARSTRYIDPLSGVVDGKLVKKQFVEAIISSIEWIEKECRDSTGINVFEQADIKVRNADISQAPFIADYIPVEYNIPN